MVRGKVAAITYASIPAKDWYSTQLLKFQSAPVELVVVSITEIEILGGSLVSSQSAFPARRPDTTQGELVLNSRLVPGAEIIATALYMVDRSEYAMHCLFVRSDDGWRRLRDSKWEDPISTQDIAERLATVSLRTIARESDLIVGATVRSTSDLGASGAGHREYLVTPYVVLKGTAAKSVTISTNQTIDIEKPDWRTLLPFELEEESSWYLFLQERNGHYVPTAGRRSAIRMKGPDLFANLNVPLGRSVASFEREVRAMTSE